MDNTLKHDTSLFTTEVEEKVQEIRPLFNGLTQDHIQAILTELGSSHGLIIDGESVLLEHLDPEIRTS